MFKQTFLNQTQTQKPCQKSIYKDTGTGIFYSSLSKKKFENLTKPASGITGQTPRYRIYRSKRFTEFYRYCFAAFSTNSPSPPPYGSHDSRGKGEKGGGESGGEKGVEGWVNFDI